MVANSRKKINEDKNDDYLYKSPKMVPQTTAHYNSIYQNTTLLEV